METCNECNKTFPAWLIHPLTSSNGTCYQCPICALKEINELHGLPEDEPFFGETANYMWEEATKHLKETNQ